MAKRISLLILISMSLLCFSSVAWGQLKVDSKNQLTRMINQRRLITFFEKHLVIIENSSALLLCGAQNIITGGSNFLGIVKSYELIANGNTAVGIAITERVHAYSGNSMALIAIGGLPKDSDGGVNGITYVDGESKVGLAVGEVAFVKENARIGAVFGDVSHIYDSARIGIVTGDVSHIRGNARIGLVAGDVSHIRDNARIGIVMGKISHIAPSARVFLRFAGISSWFKSLQKLDEPSLALDRNCGSDCNINLQSWWESSGDNTTKPLLELPGF